MSDRETILQTLTQIESRIRTNRRIGRLAVGLSVLAGVALLVRIWDLAAPLGTSSIRVFWAIWFLALALVLVWSLRERVGLNRAAATTDQKARLNDELTSAYWFLGQNRTGPWIELQVRRAAETAARLDVGALFPRVVPPTAYGAAAGLGLLLMLNFVPLPFAHTWLISGEAPPLSLSTATEDLLAELEALLDQAEERQRDEVVEQIEDLIEAIRSGEMTPEEALDQLAGMQNLLDEGNLDVASIMQGLEEMAGDLSQSDDTADAAGAMARRDLEAAADEFRKLAEEIGGGEAPDADLEQTLQEAARDPRSGLEDLARELRDAAEALERRDQESAQQSLAGAARELDELSDMVQSQQLKNRAAEQLQDLQEALRDQEQEAQAAQEGDEQQGEGEAAGQQGQEQPGSAEEAQAGGEGQQMPAADMGGFDPQQAGRDAEAEFAPGAPGEGQMGSQAAPPGENAQGLEATGTGQMPSGFGFSPEEKEGAPTSLDVQLQEEATEALSGEGEQTTEIIEELSREQRSSLDYRNVPSELSPAQQDLLNRDEIPREYRELIKEYFRAIRPRPQP